MLQNDNSPMFVIYITTGVLIIDGGWPRSRFLDLGVVRSMIIAISTTPPRKRASRKPALAHLARLPNLLRARTTGCTEVWSRPKWKGNLGSFSHHPRTEKRSGPRSIRMTALWWSRIPWQGRMTAYEDLCQSFAKTGSISHPRPCASETVRRSVTMLTEVTTEASTMKATQSTVISMRLPAASGRRLKRLANRHGWTPSDASARLVEEGLRRSEFAFIDFRDSVIGRQAYVQGSSLAIWEVILLCRGYKNDLQAVAKHLHWPLAKVQAALNYAVAFADEINEALAENEAASFTSIKRMLPQAVEFVAGKAARR